MESIYLPTVFTIIGLLLLWGLVGRSIWKIVKSQHQRDTNLLKAKNEAQIQIEIAQAKLDAATLNKQAAIIEAEAVAEQIKLMGDDNFLKWQWIKMMERRQGDTVYVLTEDTLSLHKAATNAPLKPMATQE